MSREATRRVRRSRVAPRAGGGTKRRVVLKLSGEALGPEGGFGLEVERIRAIARQLKSAAAKHAVEIALVIGAGNLVRGHRLAQQGVDPIAADYMGMLATVMNGLALHDCLEKLDQPAALLSAVAMMPMAEQFTPRRCRDELSAGRIVILVGGTGNPHFTTDTAAALRAREIGAHCLLKGTNVDGVYSANPATDPKATLYRTISYTDCLARELKVMDATAFALCREADMPIVVFNYRTAGNIERAVRGEKVGTRVGGQ